jgi:hypothetical protein
VTVARLLISLLGGLGAVVTIMLLLRGEFIPGLELASVVLPPIAGLIGAAIGFHFGAAPARAGEVRAGVRVEEAAKQLREGMSIENLFEFNRREMEQYHLQSRNRAQLSFFASLLAMLGGLTVLALGATAALQAEDTRNKVLAAAVTAIAGGLSSYITKTFMTAHQESLRQLEFYFRQPLVTSYFLTAERIAEKFLESSGQRGKAYEALIENALSAAITQVRESSDPRRQD